MSKPELMKLAQQYHDLKKETRQKEKKIKALEDWINLQGEHHDFCTKNILGVICSGCRCGKQGDNKELN